MAFQRGGQYPPLNPGEQVSPVMTMGPEQLRGGRYVGVPGQGGGRIVYPNPPYTTGPMPTPGATPPSQNPWALGGAGAPSRPSGVVSRPGAGGMPGMPAQIPQPQQPGGQPSYGSNTPTVNTSINPQPIYSPQQTQEAVNQARASQLGPQDMSWLLSRSGGAGRAIGSGSTMSNAIPQIAQGISAGGLAGAQLPFEDAAANAQHILAGQRARDAEFSGLAGLPMQQQQMANNFLMQLLQMFM